MFLSWSYSFSPSLILSLVLPPCPLSSSLPLSLSLPPPGIGLHMCTSQHLPTSMQHFHSTQSILFLIQVEIDRNSTIESRFSHLFKSLRDRLSSLLRSSQPSSLTNLQFHFECSESVLQLLVSGECEREREKKRVREKVWAWLEDSLIFFILQSYTHTPFPLEGMSVLLKESTPNHYSDELPFLLEHIASPLNSPSFLSPSYSPPPQPRYEPPWVDVKSFIRKEARFDRWGERSGGRNSHSFQVHLLDFLWEREGGEREDLLWEGRKARLWEDVRIAEHDESAGDASAGDFRSVEGRWDFLDVIFILSFCFAFCHLTFDSHIRKTFGTPFRKRRNRNRCWHPRWSRPTFSENNSHSLSRPAKRQRHPHSHGLHPEFSYRIVHWLRPFEAHSRKVEYQWRFVELRENEKRVKTMKRQGNAVYLVCTFSKRGFIGKFPQFVHHSLAESQSMLRAHVLALGGNALVCLRFELIQCKLVDGAFKFWINHLLCQPSLINPAFSLQIVHSSSSHFSHYFSLFLSTIANVLTFSKARRDTLSSASVVTLWKWSLFVGVSLKECLRLSSYDPFLCDILTLSCRIWKIGEVGKCKGNKDISLSIFQKDYFGLAKKDVIFVWAAPFSLTFFFGACFPPFGFAVFFPSFSSWFASESSFFLFFPVVGKLFCFSGFSLDFFSFTRSPFGFCERICSPNITGGSSSLSVTHTLSETGKEYEKRILFVECLPSKPSSSTYVLVTSFFFLLCDGTDSLALIYDFQ